MPKEPKPNFASFTKAELVKTVKKLDARQTKLLNRIAELEGQIAASMAQPATYKPGPYDVVHVKLLTDGTFGPGVAEAKPEDWQDANQGEVNSGRMFPWEKD